MCAEAATAAAMGDTSVEDLLSAADNLLASVTPGTRGLWPRAAAFLIRMAQEQALDEFWAGVAADVAACSMRAQLLCLGKYVQPTTAYRVAATWRGLSAACHYHTYELAPTAVELRGWLHDVRESRRQLAAGAHSAW